MTKRKSTRKLYASEIISRLKAIEKRWPDNLMLFSWSGSLILVDSDTQEILENFNIASDGGDPDSYEENGKIYLCLND